MTDKKCWCFPEEDILKQEYRDNMKENMHLGEKTAPTIINWLAGKNMRSYAMIPFYAQEDYEEYICAGKNNKMCAVTKMSGERHILEIFNALDNIARQCVCTKDK